MTTAYDVGAYLEAQEGLWTAQRAMDDLPEEVKNAVLQAAGTAVGAFYRSLRGSDEGTGIVADRRDVLAEQVVTNAFQFLNEKGLSDDAMEEHGVQDMIQDAVAYVSDAEAALYDPNTSNGVQNSGSPTDLETDKRALTRIVETFGQGFRGDIFDNL